MKNRMGYLVRTVPATPELMTRFVTPYLGRTLRGFVTDTVEGEAQKFLDGRYQLWLLIDNEGKCHGFAGTSIYPSSTGTWAHISHAFVKPGANGGLDALLSHLSNVCRQWGITGMTFHTSRNPVSSTRRLARHGFKPMSTQFVLDLRGDS